MAEKINFSQINKDFFRASSLIWQADKRIAFLNIFLQFIQAFLPILSLYYIKEMIEAVVENNHTFHNIIPLIIAFSLAQFLLAVAAQYSGYIASIHQQKLTDYLSVEVLNKAIEVDYEYYENPKYHDTLHLAQQQSLHKAGYLLTAFNTVVLNSLSLLFLVGFFFTLHSSFALIFVFLSLPLAMIKWYSGFSLMRLEKKFAPLEREAGYLHQVLTGVTYAKETRVFGFGQSFIQKFKNIRLYIHSQKKKLQLRLTIYSITAEAVEIIVMAFVFFLLAKNAWEKSITAGIFVVYIQGFQRLQSVSKNFFQSLVQLLQQRIFLQDLFIFFDIKINTPHSDKHQFPDFKKGIIVKDVSFTYPDTVKSVLHHININCLPGRIVAIVGENGSGKSTLVKLLARLYRLESGNISFDDIALSEIDEKDFRTKSVFLFQDFEKYFFTVEENIALGADAKKNVENDVINAAKLSGANSFIKSLSKGYKTRMGRLFEGSEQLSGGQWQKLALARMFYKKAQLIVLDEPTSSIDASAELNIFRNIKEQLGDKIVILITHRLYNLKIADYIYVMHEGNIAEEGEFNTLIEKQGIFKTMYEAQKL
jgi:ATP-binding cassette subfamily B protein